MHVDKALATVDEVRKLQRSVKTRLDLARKSGRLPHQVEIGDKEFLFGEDTNGDPAVWISVSTKSDPRPSDDDVAQLADLLDEIVVEVLESGARHWPYFRFHSNESVHDAA